MSRDYWAAASFGETVADYLATVLIATRRAAAFSILVVLVTVMIYAFMGKTPTTEDVVAKLRSDPELLKLLRGPEGKKGERGAIGPEGLRGPQGPPGATGPTGAQAAPPEPEGAVPK